MNKSKKPIEVQLYVVLGDGYLGPIRCTVYPWHKPSLLLKNYMDNALELPDTMRTSNPRKIYNWRNRSFLEEERTFDQQKIKTGDIVVLADHDDTFVLEEIIRFNMPPGKKSEQESRAKIVVKGFIKGIPWIGPGIVALLFGKDC